MPTSPGEPDAIDGFRAAFGRAPEALGDAPGRVNLLGEHTDYNDGFVLPIALAQRTTVALGRSRSGRFEIRSHAFARPVRFDPERLPDEPFARYVFGCIQETERRGHRVPALDVYIASEVPIGVGLSSSAALEVATLRGLRSLLGLAIDDVEVACMAQRAEIDFAGVRCGIMDQMASSLADAGHALFLDARTLATELHPLPEMCGVLVLDSGVPRSLISSEFNLRRAECEEACARLHVASLRDVGDVLEVESLDEPYRRRARHVVSENARVLRAVARSDDGAAVGELMNASHASLRDDFEVSVPALDRLVALLQSHEDVRGAKLTGAGFGGACVALCAADRLGTVARDVIEVDRREGGRARVLAPPALA